MLRFRSCAIVALSLSCSLSVWQARAQSSPSGLKDFTIHQPYLSVRALGMGNAFTALADDYNALFYNPAGLARLEEGQINLGIGAGGDVKALELKSDIDRVSGGEAGKKENEMVALLESKMGDHYSARVPTVSAFWVRPKWGFAFIPADLNIEAEVRRLGIASLFVTATQDSTLAYGRGWDVNWFRDTRVSLGMTGKAVYRAAYSNTIFAPDLAQNKNIMRAEDAKEGLTFDADLGILMSPRNAAGTGWGRLFRPSLGMTVRNVVDYGFTSNMHLVDKNSSGQPPKLGRRFDVGTMWELPEFWIFNLRGMVDIRDMGHENWAFRKGLHAGVEFQWKIRSWWQGGWRVGVNQGYFTAGFTGKLAVFNLDIATYAEEVGPSDARNANRRYVAKASLDW